MGSFFPFFKIILAFIRIQRLSDISLNFFAYLQFFWSSSLNLHMAEQKMLSDMDRKLKELPPAQFADRPLFRNARRDKRRMKNRLQASLQIVLLHP